MKKFIVPIALISFVFIGCQARPKSDRQVQIKANENGKVVTQNLTPIPLLASERLLWSMALTKVLLEGLLTDSVPQISGCEARTADPNQVTFSRCKKENIDFSGTANLRSAAGNEIKDLNFEVTISEKDKIGGRLEAVATKLETAITGLNLERDQGNTKIYSATLKIVEKGKDQGLARLFEASGTGLRLTLVKNKLTAFRFGKLTVKLQRDQKKINKGIFVESDDMITYEGKFWKGSFLTKESSADGALPTEVAFAEGAISLPSLKDAPALSVQCTPDKVESMTAQISDEEDDDTEDQLSSEENQIAGQSRVPTDLSKFPANQTTTATSQPVGTTTTTKSAADVLADNQTPEQKKAAAVLRCLIANLHQSGPGRK